MSGKARKFASAKGCIWGNTDLHGHHVGNHNSKDANYTMESVRKEPKSKMASPPF